MTYEWPLKLLSLAVAGALWIYVTNERDPIITRTVKVRVQAVNVPQGLVVLSMRPSEVEVKLRGRRSALQEAERQVVAVVDLKKLQVGSHQVPVIVKSNPPGTEVVGVSDFYVTAELDLETEAERPVIIELRGLPAEGFQAQSPRARPPTVKVRGAASLLRRVAKVVATVDISGMSAPLHQAVSVQARDEMNLPVPGVSIEPEEVQVEVPIRKVNVKTVPVWPRLSDPAPGFRVAAVAVRPPAVVIGGPRGVLASIRSIRTQTIDISTLRGTGTYNARLVLPGGVRVFGPASVYVRVTVEQIPEIASPAPEEAPAAQPPGPQEEQPAAQPAGGNSQPAAQPPPAAPQPGPAGER